MTSSITNEIINIQNATAQANSTRERSQEMDQDAFLQLMMLQLKNQDPTNPMDSTEFLAQQAQFTQISELQKLNQNMTQSTVISQASSMIGREVVMQDPNNADSYIQGVVECASFDSKGNVNLVIDGKEYPLDLLMILGNQQQTSGTTPETEPKA